MSSNFFGWYYCPEFIPATKMAIPFWFGFKPSWASGV
jgi:hypothetical protein